MIFIKIISSLSRGKLYYTDTYVYFLDNERALRFEDEEKTIDLDLKCMQSQDC